ncbi:MAG: DUF370 domain-containing protein [Clostridia bacterium]|nr:DUF370 domain-containing protein [Clostridia bacterium]
MRMLNIGYGNLVATDKLISIISPESAPIKRLIQDNRERGRIVDATFGRRTKSLLVMENGYIILSALMPETIAARLEDKE